MTRNLEVWLLALIAVALLLGEVPSHAQEESQIVNHRSFILDGGEWYETTGGGMTRLMPSRLTVGFHASASDVQVAAFIDSLGLEVRRNGWRGLQHFSLPPGLSPVEAYATAVASPLVSFAEPSLQVTLYETPSDGLWSKQWNLKSPGQDFLSAWEIEPGDSTVVIAILDSGVNTAHPDLRGNLWRNWGEIPLNAADDDSNGFVDDYWGWNFLDGNGSVEDIMGHGSYMTGLACAMTNNDTVGIAGAAGGWSEEGWSVGDRGVGCRAMTLVVSGGGSDDVAEAIVYAVENGAEVMSMSLGCGSEPALVDSAIEWAASQGVVFCAAAGNGGDPLVCYPARDSLVIGVGAVFRNDDWAYFSNYDDSLDVVAPSGACVYASECYEQRSQPCADFWQDYWGHDPPGCAWYPLSTAENEGLYGRFSGTSSSCPQVAALAALLRSLDPTLTAAQVRYLIRVSAEDQLGGEYDTAGRDQRHGYGRVNAYQALFVAQRGGTTSSDLRLCYDVSFDRDVKVSAGNTLTVLPGVTVEFAANSDAANLGVDATRCELIVEGTLIAHGIDANTVVTFTSSGTSAGDWYGIRAPADTGSLDLRYCAIENAYKGVAVDNSDALELAYLEIDNCTAHGIYCKNCDSSAKVDSCTITNPGVVGIEARDCTGMTLRGHSITDATDYGIKCYDVAGMTVTGNYILGDSSSEDFVGIRVKPVSDTSSYLIEKNTVERCSSRGIWCAKGLGDDASVEKNCISDSSYTRGGTGVYFYKSSAKMRQTTVETKTHGVVAICGQSSPTSPFWRPDLGDTTNYQENGDNRFLDNSLYYVWTMDLGGNRLAAENNYFVATGVDCPPTPSKFYGARIDRSPCLDTDPGQQPRIAPDGGPDSQRPRTALSQNWPNPFNPATTIRFDVPQAGLVTLRIFNAAGKHVRTLVDNLREAGTYYEVWDGRDDEGRELASGVYFAKLDVDWTTEVRKLVLLR